MGPLEVTALAAALLLPLFFVLYSVPLGVPACLAVAGVVAVRWRAWSREASAGPSRALPAAHGRRRRLPSELKTAEPKTSPFGKGFLQDCWWFAALSSELKPGKLQRYEMLGEPVLLAAPARASSTRSADICPHRAAPLSAGRLVEDEGEPRVECPYHGWRFGLDGGCRAIPSLLDDQEMDPARIRVRSYPVRESQGLVWIWMASDPRASAEPDHDPPTFEGVVGGAPRIVERMDFDSHIDHAVVGLMDPTHGPYVHQQWWWRSAASQHEKRKAFAPRPYGFAMTRHAPSKNSRAYRLLGGAPETEITFRLPGLRWEHVRYGSRTVMTLTCLTPLDERRTRITQIFWSDLWAFNLLKPARPPRRQDLPQAGRRHGEPPERGPPLRPDSHLDRRRRPPGQMVPAAQARMDRQPPGGPPFNNPVPETVLRWRS
jgi:phenylpropionate dioxygenase-like ring-hydroxylating dioxygenase large terminal subunit